MRLEEKELEGPDLEREQRLEELEDETRENDKEMPEHAGPEVESETAARSRMFDALQAILAGENLSIPMLYLPQREALALEALQSAVSGRDRSMNTFVFAEDRKSLLEQALAVLQQNLTRGDAETLATLHAKFEDLTESVADLRGELLGLEDAQDDLIEQKQHEVKTGTPETDDKDDDSVTGFIASALNALAQVAQVESTEAQPFRSTLVGPDLPDATPFVSTLDGPEVKVVEKTSSLDGPEPIATSFVSMLDAAGPEVTKADHVSALDGPEVVPEEKRSTLFTEGMSALIVPEHLRPRVAEHPPVGMRTDDHVERAHDEHVDDGRGPATPTTQSRQREPEPPKRDSSRQMQSTASSPLSKPSEKAADEPAKPEPRRGLSVRSSEKPGKKK